MTTNPTSRRALLAGAVSTAAAATAFPVVANASPAPDTELRTMFAKAQELKVKSDAAFDHSADVSKLYSAELPPRPEMTDKYPRELAEMFSAMKFGEFRRLPDDHPIKVWENKTEAAYQEKLAAYNAAAARVDKKYGMKAAEGAADEALTELFDFGLEIFSRPAESIAGMLIKVRTVKLLGYEDDMPKHEMPFWHALVDDIEKMAAAAGVSV